MPSFFKVAQIIILKNSDKTAREVTSHRPISLLPAVSKLSATFKPGQKMDRNGKIKLNEAKSVHVLYTLRHTDSIYRVYLGSQPVLQVDSVKYLGMHLDAIVEGPRKNENVVNQTQST